MFYTTRAVWVTISSNLSLGYYVQDGYIEGMCLSVQTRTPKKTQESNTRPKSRTDYKNKFIYFQTYDNDNIKKILDDLSIAEN